MQEEVVSNKTGWFACPSSLILNEQLSKQAKLVWLNFAAHLNNKTGACFPSAKTQAKEIKISVHAVCTARKELMESGYLAKSTIKDEAHKIIRWQWDLTEEATLQKNHNEAIPQWEKTTMRETDNLTTRTINNKKTKQQEPLTIIEINKKKEIDRIFETFQKTINPSISYGNTTQRAAARWLIKEFGIDNVLGYTKAAISIQGQDYAPTITNPFELKEKLAKLKAFFERAKRGSGIVKIS